MRVRKKVSGTAERPRMTVFRSNKQIYVQFIDDLRGVTLASASSLDKEVAEQMKGINKCQEASSQQSVPQPRASRWYLSTATVTFTTDELNSWPTPQGKADLNFKRLCQIPT